MAQLNSLLFCKTVPVARTYWFDLFTVETWKEFQDRGSDVPGSSEKRCKTVQRMKPGDYLLCYLTRVSRWVGLLEVVGEPYFDEEPIWSAAATQAGCLCVRCWCWPRSMASQSWTCARSSQSLGPGQP
jgi:hypothetical protein